LPIFTAARQHRPDLSEMLALDTTVQPKAIAHPTTADEARNREAGCLG